MTVVSKAIRGQVNASSGSPKVKRAARKGIGQRFKKVRQSNIREAVVGYAVGKKKDVELSERKAVSATTGWDGGTIKITGVKRRGVGIGTRNIHWFALGTQERFTGKATSKRSRRGGVSRAAIRVGGHRTGKLRPMEGVIPKSVSMSAGPAIAAAKAKIAQVIIREARRSH